MIQEYAFDPSVLAAEFSQQYGFLRDSFNDTGRVLSQYPVQWRQNVMDALNVASERERIKLEVLLTRWLLPHSIVRKNSAFEGGDWLQETEGEDAKLAFHGILSNANPRGHDRVIPFEDVVSGDHHLWDCTRSCRALKTAPDIVNAVAPLLKRAKRIVLIDPYFLMEPRFYGVLVEMIQVLTSDDCIFQHDEIQICTALKGRWDRLPDAQARNNLTSYFRGQCERLGPRLIPSGFKVNFTVYFPKKHGIDAHDRHILTNIAGVDFGQGLDQRQNEEDENHVRVNLLDYDECCRLEDDFQPHMTGASASYHVEDEFTVEGQA